MKHFPKLPVEISACCMSLGFTFGLYYAVSRDWKWATYWGLIFLLNAGIVYRKWFRKRNTDDIF